MHKPAQVCLLDGASFQVTGHLTKTLILQDVLSVPLFSQFIIHQQTH